MKIILTFHIPTLSNEAFEVSERQTSISEVWAHCYGNTIQQRTTVLCYNHRM